MTDRRDVMIVSKRFVRMVPILVSCLILGSCIDGGPGPVPRDSVEVAVDLAPGATETYEFEVEVETFGTDWPVSLRTSPESDSLRADGVAVEQSWTRDGVTAEGWPDYIDDIGSNEQMPATLSLTLTNEGPTRFEEELSIIITSSGDIPEPSEEDLRVEIRQR